jgi:L-ascorbate metabolism protein UlaG (beta-lactamase superfamily)
MNYSIISTGSKGNAVVLNGNIMIDCGVPFVKLKDICKYLRLVLLTHCHGDHFNRSTIRRLANERPALRWGCPEWLVNELVGCGVDKRNIDVIFCDNIPMYYSGFCTVWSRKIPHNVDNCCYHIYIENGGKKIFYATDTNSLDGINAENYDLYLVEANYSEAEIIERIRRKQEAGEHCYEWDVLKNHLSREKAEDWVYRNAGADSMYVFLHGHEEKED